MSESDRRSTLVDSYENAAVIVSGELLTSSATRHRVPGTTWPD